jgi:hypothetical protein
MKPEQREPVVRAPLKCKPLKRYKPPTGVSKTHAKRDRGRARAQKRKLKEAEQARRDALGKPKRVGGGLVWQADAPEALLKLLRPGAKSALMAKLNGAVGGPSGGRGPWGGGGGVPNEVAPEAARPPAAAHADMAPPRPPALCRNTSSCRSSPSSARASWPLSLDLAPCAGPGGAGPGLARPDVSTYNLFHGNSRGVGEAGRIAASAAASAARSKKGRAGPQHSPKSTKMGRRLLAEAKTARRLAREAT